MFIERDLVRLVMQLNPYAPFADPPAAPNMNFASGAPPNPIPVLTQEQADRISAAAIVGGSITALNDALDRAQIPRAFTVFNFETQDNPGYQLNWTWHFKGQDRIIRRALRLPYRYPVKDGNGALATDYVLIGFEGGGGP